MRILIYGAGVIGSLYAVRFAKAGFDVSVFARGKRLSELKKEGLLYYEGSQIEKIIPDLSEKPDKDDIYDFIFLTVRENQVEEALHELRFNKSPTIVTMVNTSDPYEKWEHICGKGRILPAFPGAGGSIDHSVLNAGFTPRIIQPTSFGEIDGKKSRRVLRLKKLFKDSGIPSSIISDMHSWQISHLAMVVPMADAYYEACSPECVGKDPLLMLRTAKRLKRNFQWLKKSGFRIIPVQLNIFRILPSFILMIGLALLYQSSFAYRFMYKHSVHAPDEMKRLHLKFYGFLQKERKRHNPKPFK